MRRVFSLGLLTVTILAADSAFAQQRPSFAGRWTLAPDSAPAGGRGGRGATTGDMGSGWGSPLTITQDATTLIVEYAFFTRADMQPPLRFNYSLTGAETKNSVMMGRGIQEQMSKTAWQGDRLVITTAHPFAHPVTGEKITSVVTQTLSLASPTALLVETTRAGVLGGAPSTTRSRFTKS